MVGFAAETFQNDALVVNGKSYLSIFGAEFVHHKTTRIEPFTCHNKLYCRNSGGWNVGSAPSFSLDGNEYLAEGPQAYAAIRRMSLVGSLVQQLQS